MQIWKQLHLKKEANYRKLPQEHLKTVQSFIRSSPPDSVQTIEENGFAHCKNLVPVDLGNGLKNIENNAFYYSGVTRFVFPAARQRSVASTLYECRSLNDITLGSGLKGIESGVFYHCSNLKQIELPDNITYISDNAFGGSGLTSVEIPDSVTSIGNWAFYGCQSLKKAVIGNNLAYIANNAFGSWRIDGNHVGR